MQTFLISPVYSETAAALDTRRLGKQGVECLQILNVLNEIPDPVTGRPRTGWVNHPAVRMWRGYEYQLALYGLDMCQEYIKRGHSRERTKAGLLQHLDWSGDGTHDVPDFVNDIRLHLAHKSALIRKFPEHYRELWPEVPDDIAEYWPVPLKGGGQ